MRDSKSGEARLVQDICETACRGGHILQQVSIECRDHIELVSAFLWRGAQVLLSTMLHASAAIKTGTRCPGCGAFIR